MTFLTSVITMKITVTPSGLHIHANNAKKPTASIFYYTLKMEAASLPETVVPTYQPTGCPSQENSILTAPVSQSIYRYLLGVRWPGFKMMHFVSFVCCLMILLTAKIIQHCDK